VNKQSRFLRKIGGLPEGWRIDKFENVTDLITCGLASTPKYVDPEVGVPFLSAQNVQNGRLALDKYRFIGQDLHNKLTKKNKPLQGDILYSRVGANYGEAAIIDIDWEFSIYVSLTLIKVGKDQDTNYYKYLLNSELCKRQAIVGVFQGGGVQNLNVDIVRKFDVVVPPLAEQRRIAEILGAWDEAISLTQRLIAAKQRRKQGLMQRLLTGSVRLPGFATTDATQETKYGEIPADWEYLPIQKIARQVSTKNKNGKDLTVLSCTKYDGLVDSLEYFGRQIYSDVTSTFKIVKRGQFAYATNHIEEGSIGYQDLYDEALISPMYTVFETTSRDVSDEFLFRVLKTELYRHIFEVNTSSSVNRRGSLRWPQFALIRVPVPSINEQRAIAAVLQTADEEIGLLGRKLSALRAQKKGLMQRLLTGEVRVKAEG